MPVNSIVNTPQNTTYFRQFTATGKGFKIVDSTVNLQDLSSIDFDQFESNSNDEFNQIGIGSSYFFESSQLKLNPCKTILTKESLKQPAKTTEHVEREQIANKQGNKNKKSVPNTGVPNFSKFYEELKSLKKVDPNMRSKLSFTYFC